MALNVQILYVTKTDSTAAHKRIYSVGGLNPGGSPWNLTEDEAIVGIKAGKWRFWTTGGGKTAWVIVARTAQGHEYLKTQRDGVIPHNLLALPECPLSIRL